MGRTTRRRVAENIYADGTGYSVAVKVGGVQRERRYPKDTPMSVMKRWRDELRVELRKLRPTKSSGTLEADVETYIAQIKHLVSWRERHAELKAWVRRIGYLPRARITTDHVREARQAWLAAGKAPKTVNMRVFSLQHLFRLLDASPERPKPWTPCDGLKPLTVHKTPAVAVPLATIAAVAKQLEAHEGLGWLRDAKTRARFMVLASTGKRPSELMRAEADDVDLLRRVWTVRDGKGGWSPGIYLNDDMLAAWKLFVRAEAWGVFDVGSYARRLYTAGWPKTVRPYNLRHTVGIGLSELGIDLADIQAHMGHRRIETTRRHYVPVLNSRLEEASRRLDHRFGWSPRTAKKRAG